MDRRLPLDDVFANVKTANNARDWKGILMWEGRIEELLAARQTDGVHAMIILMFSTAHKAGFHATGWQSHAISFVGLEQRRIPLLGKLELFRDQGEALCGLAGMLLNLKRDTESARRYQEARDVAEAHGFFLVESEACRGLGRSAMDEGRHKDGVKLLQNALAAAELNELDHRTYALEALEVLIGALFQTHAIDDVEPLVLRYREAVKTDSETGFCWAELDSLFYSARLHEVRRFCTLRWEHLFNAWPLFPVHPNSVSLSQVPPPPREDPCTC